MTKISNPWITLDKQRNGVTVQRSFAGIYPLVGQPDSDGESEVKQCIIYYWERELYPNGEVIKVEMKNYTLQDLPYSEIEISGSAYSMEALAVLTGFIQSLGYPGIINPSRDTLENTTILPLTVENEYPLKRDTREKTLKNA